jgi:polysulfide reductase chain C
MVWNEIIVGYLFLAGMGAGCFVFSVLLGWKNPKARTARLTDMIIALAAVAIGTLLLMLDAKAGFHNPLRFILLFSNWGSVMTWGTAILSLYLVCGFIDFLLYAIKKSTPKALDWICIILSVCVAVYTGVLLGVTEAYPLWNLVVLPLLFLVSAGGTGFAAGLLGGQIADRDAMRQVTFHEKTVAVMPIIEAILLVILLVVTVQGTGALHVAGAATVAAITTGAFAPLFWLGLVAVGLVVPCVIDSLSLKKAQPLGAVMTAEVCVLIGGFILRYLVVLAAVPAVTM